MSYGHMSYEELEMRVTAKLRQEEELNKAMEAAVRKCNDISDVAATYIMLFGVNALHVNTYLPGEQRFIMTVADKFNDLHVYGLLEREIYKQHGQS